MRKIMLDDIGLGSAIANTIYGIILLIGAGGVFVLSKKRLLLGLIFWISSILNLLLHLFLMGKYPSYPKFLYIVVNNYWPWINLALFILLIINFIKNKYAKKENS
jgi:hypothetical protein